MLHQSLPLYEGNQPFIYACYCAEDDDIAFPVLARMYNEGFRIWCASAGDITQDFRTIQRMNASSTVMLFLSKGMLELLRTGDPEAVAVAKSPRLHITVSIDGSEADPSMWALAVPEALEYKPGNDAAFWLFMYTSEKLERCRGPWPEKKIKYRESSFDFISEKALQDEYEQLETIIGSEKPSAPAQGAAAVSEKDNAAGRASYEGAVPQPARPADRESQRYPNNPGYIQPQPDEYVYLPLDKLEVTKSETEKEFDAFIGYLDRSIAEEERSVAQQLAEMRYYTRDVPGQAAKSPEQAAKSPEQAANERERAANERERAANERERAENMPERGEKSPEQLENNAGQSEKASEQPGKEPEQTAVPVPELTPRFTDPAERNKPVSKVDRVITPDDRLSADSLNPEARRRRMYEDGRLDKVLDPNDIDAVVQRRRKEEREKAEQRQREADEAAARQAEMILDAIDKNGQKQELSAGDQDGQTAQPSPGQAQSKQEDEEREAAFDRLSDASPAGEKSRKPDNSRKNKQQSGSAASAPAASAIAASAIAGISEESLESIIDSSDPSFPGGMPSSEQLASAPTYVMLTPAGGAAIDAPTCLKLIEAEGGMIAVPAPMPEDILSDIGLIDGAPNDGMSNDSRSIDGTSNDGMSIDGKSTAEQDMFIGAPDVGGNEYSDIGASYDTTGADNADKKRHTVVRKVIHRREGVKVKPYRCEVLHELPGREKEEAAQHNGSRRAARGAADIERALNSAPSAAETAAQSSSRNAGAAEAAQTEETSQGGRKFRSRPAPSADISSQGIAQQSIAQQSMVQSGTARPGMAPSGIAYSGIAPQNIFPQNTDNSGRPRYVPSSKAADISAYGADGAADAVIDGVADAVIDGAADAVMDELELRQSHRKNRHPHSQSGLLANVIAMLSRGASHGALSAIVDGVQDMSDTVGEQPADADDGIPAGTAAGYESAESVSAPGRSGAGRSVPGSGSRKGGAASGDGDAAVVPSLSAAVEKFIEIAPLEPVLVVPRRK